MPLSRTARGVAVAFTVSGVVHLVRPQTFAPAMPSWVPAHREVILASGVAELACAAGLASPRTRGVAGKASALLLLAVFPGNVQMALDAQKGRNTPWKVGTLARLPLQWPMIRATWNAGR
ncbi:DoxX family protein [Nocardioides sp. TRM66260-LWL]|uniref:DoxX family protein n=1 Tax=Nocardioides sp. TRM66260-LWL TaxID=2874478 RepID=UPI001CC37581|nr:DoxX family protein [Nocardioides sp. TRM66260-LWL]MBZ5734376.1 DoxX family protein [Nocardioides sp. TRM66260-LWL]